MFQAPPIIIPSQPHLSTSLSEEIYSGWLTSPCGAEADSLSRSLGWEINTSFFICWRVLSLPQKDLRLQSERSFIPAVKNNNLYYRSRGLVSKKNYASIPGHFRPLVICLPFHKNVYLSLQGDEASQHCSQISNGWSKLRTPAKDLNFNSLIGSAGAFVFPFHSLSALVCGGLASPGAGAFKRRKGEQVLPEWWCLSPETEGLPLRFSSRILCQLDVNFILPGLSFSIIIISVCYVPLGVGSYSRWPCEWCPACPVLSSLLSSCRCMPKLL